MHYVRKMMSRALPHRCALQLRQLSNALRSDETIEESKKKWEQLAKKNANYFVMTGFGEDITEGQFSTSGREDYNTLIQNDAFFKELHPLNKRCILEIGCGTGRMTEFIAEDFQEVHGIDIASEMIEHAQKRLQGKTNIHLTESDGLHIPKPDNFFDVVFSYIVFQHMPNRKAVKKNLEESVRVLKNGGLAKIQLRGIPTTKGKWFYGPSSTLQQLNTMIKGLPVQVLKTEGEGAKYFWVWLRKI